MAIRFPLDQAFIVGIWLEGCFYGIFIPIFGASVYVLVAKKGLLVKLNLPILIAAILMFALATAHVTINVYRLIHGFVLNESVPGAAVLYLYSLSEPTQKAKDIVYVTQSLLGDGLNIYRSWLIWNKNWRIPVFPMLLWLTTCVVGYYIPGYLFQFYQTDSNIFGSRYRTYVTIWYTLTMVQNIITTSLIAFRLWRHERQIGDYRTGNFSLTSIIQIILESAAIYVAAQVVLLVTYACSDNAQYVLLEIITPLVGIVSHRHLQKHCI
ncbi:hypothetical protein DACRYDRAFT_82382 [Dacryopinax primogenitus]|uniref:Serpentine receptor class gamma n=1 Tax=Dacryopinax primogenitus (strain DJM 731) TaxID=1858805 RepID=M5G0C4_DACPD|nr:uncharacterized protein DACRYDRAFT_82382 [Dacryopinax primogenitus]EJT99281.1 hypothetical protein DACRYDRAFT_82382 [Dacryopinax primogenitus]